MSTLDLVLGIVGVVFVVGGLWMIWEFWRAPVVNDDGLTLEDELDLVILSLRGRLPR